MAVQKRPMTPTTYLASQTARARAMAQKTGGNAGELLDLHSIVA